MSENQELDRNLPASPYKLGKAREKGQVPKSPDVVSAAVFLAAMVFLAWQGWNVCRDHFRMDQRLLVQAGRMEMTAATVLPLLRDLVFDAFLLLAPFLATVMVVGALSNLLQTGPVLSFHPVKPDWERLNPAGGFKRVFEVKTLAMAFRALLKLALLGMVVIAALKALVPQFFHLANLSSAGLLHLLLEDISSLGLKISMGLAFIALLDLIYTRREFQKKMRMSRREMKEELKHREGDPRIRARLRELRRQTLRKIMALRRTKEANVLITNPTHVAVALRYKHGEMPSPQLVAKGRGFLAVVMRKIAARHHIPVVQNPSLARQLYQELSEEHLVPPHLYTAVARIIVWVFAQREALKSSGRAGDSTTLGTA